MTTLTINIADQSAEKKVKDFLDKMGLDYLVEHENAPYKWWEDKNVIREFDNRIKSWIETDEQGYSFEDIEKEIAKRSIR